MSQPFPLVRFALPTRKLLARPASELGELWAWLWWRIRGPRRLRPDGLTIAQAEERFRRRRFETAYVFDRHGRQLLRQEGAELSVVVDPVPPKDAVVVHNHPPDRRYRPDDPRYDGGSFSSTDLDFAVWHDLSEIRVVTEHWLHIATRPSGGWPVDADTMVAICQDVESVVRNEMREALAMRRVTAAEADAREVIRDEVVRRVASIVGFGYRRERL
jgi:hypothetical protein